MSVLFVSTWQDAGEPAVRKAFQVYQETGCLLTACEQGLVEVELDPRFMAVGLGSLPNTDGEQELDAGIMDGDSLAIGSVCALRGVVPAISVARKVMEETPHVMLAGDQARRFAERMGFSPRCLHSPESLRRYEAWRLEQSAPEVAHQEARDTVTLVGWERRGEKVRVVSACSTSGLAWKLPGRVGDSPIAGAGFYADSSAGASGATGVGEDIWRFLLSFRVVEAMREGAKAQEACEKAISLMVTRKPSTQEKCSAVFGVSREGDWGASATKEGFVAWVCRDGKIEAHKIPGIGALK
ncbi:MAG: N(4)-(beta-N-acetylglucosaminyl)-L-asparaginase [Fimbriimonadales bacterium]|nr:N(4)-(beta-N-acetylglucosaminyl)-L-asparaginase [Fimbriimonadales bacterium]